jgi:hypothetical protein
MDWEKWCLGIIRVEIRGVITVHFVEMNKVGMMMMMMMMMMIL